MLESNEPSIGGDRMTWMDVLRGLAILAVVLFHSGTLLRYAGLQVPSGMADVNRAVAPFRIPMLVLLSGMLLPRAIRKGPARYLHGKARAILWPFLVWSGVIGLIMWTHHGLASVKWLVPSVLIGGTYLWYLFFLIIFYGAALLMQRVPRLPAAAAFLVVAELMPDDTKYLERLTFLFSLFLFGWWIAERPGGLDRLVRATWALPLAVVVGAGSYLVTDMSGYGPRAVVGTLAVVFVLAWVAARASRARLALPLRFVGQNSVVFYVVHFPLVQLLMTVVGTLGIENAPVVLAVAFVAAIAAGTVLSRRRSTSGFVAGLFVAPVMPKLPRWRGLRTDGATPNASDRQDG